MENSRTSQVKLRDLARGPLYWWRPDYEYTIATTHKVASTTLAWSLGSMNQFLEYSEPPADKPVILVVRHPLDRLVSAFEWFVRGPHNIVPHSNGRRFGYIDFPAFVMYAETHMDMHWTPQTYQHPNWRSFELLPLEHLRDWWPADQFGELMHRKQTQRGPWDLYFDDKLKAQCEKLYSEDIECYERAIDSGIHTR